MKHLKQTIIKAEVTFGNTTYYGELDQGYVSVSISNGSTKPLWISTERWSRGYPGYLERCPLGLTIPIAYALECALISEMYKAQAGIICKTHETEPSK